MTREQWDELFLKVGTMPLDELEKIIVDSARKAGVLQTNYDRLISKTPEELAEFFGTLPCCPPGNADELCFPDNTCGADTKMMIKCWANWLKGPVEVDYEPDP